jgi:hypothetical protein
MSSGTTVGLPYTTPLTWDMQGMSITHHHHPSSGLTTFRIYRNYVTQDILRRIMSDYFGYDVHFVMNITDIEDKVTSTLLQVYSQTDSCCTFR